MGTKPEEEREETRPVTRAGTGVGAPDVDAAAAVDPALAQETRRCFFLWRSGDPQAGADLFALHQTWLREQVGRALGSRLRTKVDPEDVEQEVGCRLLHYSPKEEDGSVERFRGLLRTMLAHAIADLHRHHFDAEKRAAGVEVRVSSDSRLRSDPPRDAPTSPSGVFQRVQDVMLARVTFWFVEPEKRDLIALRHWYDVPFAELVDRFGADVGSLRMRHFRAMHEFARVMAKVKGALAALPAAEVELLREQAGQPAGGASTIDSRVVAASRVQRFAQYLAALQHVAALIGEPLRPLPDSWPRTLLEARRS